jgi:LmbE family N-acetylglucosaminyl deacetylase
MIFAPHQDDETFGCGGLIALKRELGAKVTIVFLTDGHNSHRRFQDRRSPDGLVTTRKCEAVAAAQRLGVPSDCLHFLDLPDSRLAELFGEARLQATLSLDSLIQRHQPDEVYLPHRHDQLDDHEATYELVSSTRSILASPPRLFQYPIWMAWLSPMTSLFRSGDFRGSFRASIASVMGKKRFAIQAYQSQLQILPHGFVSRFAAPHEVFFELRIPDHSP